MADYTPVTWTTGNTATATQFTALSAALAEEEAVNKIQNARLDRLDSAITVMPRYAVVIGSGITTSSTNGSVNLSYFTADRNMTVSSITMRTGGTAAAATPTLIRMGIYSEALTQDLTLIASTPNDTTLFATASTMYTKALSATVDLTIGSRYAAAMLIITGATAPTIAAGQTVEPGILPRLMASVPTQTDLPSTVAPASLSTSGGFLYYRLA